MKKSNIPFFKDLKKTHKIIETNPEISISFLHGVKVSINGYSKKTYRIEFWNNETLEYFTDIRPGFFASPSKKYFVNWKIRVYDGERLLREEILDLKDKKVHIQFDSSSIGDTIAWVEQANRFAKIHNCKVILTTFLNNIFEKKSYENIIWNEPGTRVDADFKYKIGYFLGENKFDYTPIDPKTVTLSRVPCDILGIDYIEESPSMIIVNDEREILEKYVCISTHSTAAAKFWQCENGWQDVIDFLNSNGYKVAVIQKEPTSLKNIIDLSGNIPFEKRINQLKHCEFFIGLGSGISWLAWALHKKVVLISGFSDAFAEFSRDCTRIINKDVCNSCWNDTSETFDKGDWNWCPRLKNTERQFECSKMISSETVINKLKELL